MLNHLFFGRLEVSPSLGIRRREVRIHRQVSSDIASFPPRLHFPLLGDKVPHIMLLRVRCTDISPYLPCPIREGKAKVAYVFSGMFIPSLSFVDLIHQ